MNALGYNHPRVKQVLRKQIKRPFTFRTCSTTVSGPSRGNCANSQSDRIFTNSGAESVEACLKFPLCRTAGHAGSNGSGKKFRVLSMDNAFHGRTLGALRRRRQKYREPFEPLVPGFEFVEANIADLERSSLPMFAPFSSRRFKERWDLPAE